MVRLNAPFIAAQVALLGAFPLLLATVGRPAGPEHKGGICKGYQAAAALALTLKGWVGAITGVRSWPRPWIGLLGPHLPRNSDPTCLVLDSRP